MDAINYLAIVRPSEMVVLESTTLELLDKHVFFPSTGFENLHYWSRLKKKIRLFLSIFFSRF